MLYLETEFLREPYVFVLPDVLGKDLAEEMECTLIKFVDGETGGPVSTLEGRTAI